MSDTVPGEAVGTLEDQALQRKERLNSLKRKINNKTNSTEVANDSKSQKLPRPIFRSYKPQDEVLRESILPDAERPDIEDAVQDQLAAATEKLPIADLDITNLAPRKPDWDLKRDCTKKFEKLEQLTKQAIAELIRERLKESMVQLQEPTISNT